MHTFSFESGSDSAMNFIIIVYVRAHEVFQGTQGGKAQSSSLVHSIVLENVFFYWPSESMAGLSWFLDHKFGKIGLLNVVVQITIHWRGMM